MPHSKLLLLPLLLSFFVQAPAVGTGMFWRAGSSSSCGGSRQVSPGRPVVVTSPGYPADHARRQRCSWRLQPSDASDVITLVCTDVDLAGFRLGVRLGDYLRVRTSGQSRLIQYRDLLHCADVPLKIQGKPGAPMSLRFSSDGMFQRRGFSCQASVPPRNAARHTSQHRECGMAFVSEAATNVTPLATQPPEIELVSPIPADKETSTVKPGIRSPLPSHLSYPTKSGPSSEASHRPPSTSAPSLPASIQLSTWYEVSDAYPTTDSARPEEVSQFTARTSTFSQPSPELSLVRGRPLLFRRGGQLSASVPLLRRGRSRRQQEEEEAGPVRLPTRTADLRVAGGEEATPHAYPWAAFLVLTVKGEAGFICGASVVSRRYLLTAAHCVDRADSATALLGYHALQEPGPYSVQVPAAETVVHPGWSARLVKHDIALLRLEEPIEFNVAVRPICLPTREQVAETFAGRQATVVGWGGVGGGGGGSGGRLMAAQLPLLANCRCQLVWPAVVTPLKLCAGGRQGTSACGGDSGGALQVTSGAAGQGHAVLVGVVSWGSAFGCDRGRPSGYTRVTPYLDWIEKESDVTIALF